jgi:NAD(P)H-dependent flavin oxidoreductase YrpB (nitropropane dioxygenase family)
VEEEGIEEEEEGKDEAEILRSWRSRLPDSLPLSSLLPSVIASLPPPSSSSVAAEEKNPIPILAAGGLRVGLHFAGVLGMGACAEVFGTKFLLSEESCYGREQKEAIRDAEVGRMERSDAF